MWKSSQLFGKCVVCGTGVRKLGNTWVGELAAVIWLKKFLKTALNPNQIINQPLGYKNYVLILKLWNNYIFFFSNIDSNRCIMVNTDLFSSSMLNVVTIISASMTYETFLSSTTHIKVLTVRYCDQPCVHCCLQYLSAAWPLQQLIQFQPNFSGIFRCGFL